MLGVVAAGVLVVNRLTVDNGPTPTLAAASCQVRTGAADLPADGTHPPKKFFEPGETTPLGDFGHVLGDGYLVVLYKPALAADEVTQLRDFVTGPDGVRVIAGPVPDQSQPIRALNRVNSVTCNAFDLGAVQDFTRQWFADPRSKSA